MKTVLYDWLGLNDWVFNALYEFNNALVSKVWQMLSYGYSHWAALFIVLLISAHYLKTRHTATEEYFVAMSEIMAVLILGFSLVWCTLYTLQTTILWPRPWALYPDIVSVPDVVLWHEGFPASAPAIAMIVASIFWRIATPVMKVVLVAYVVAGCLLSVVSGVSWPADVVWGTVVGFVGVRLARLYYRQGVRLICST